jgi:hypothetical protein
MQPTPTGGLWFPVPAIDRADTPKEAFNAFQDGWYARAVDYPGLLVQLDDIVLDGSYSEGELADNGLATIEAGELGCDLTATLNAQKAHYVPEGDSILVVLSNGTSFRVFAATGGIQQVS